MSGLTLTERLKKLNKIDSTIDNNQDEASLKVIVSGSTQYVYQAMYSADWFDKNIGIINEIVSGISVNITMKVNRGVIKYRGTRIIKKIGYDSGYVTLDFAEGDRLEFQKSRMVHEPLLLICGASPRDHKPESQQPYDLLESFSEPINTKPYVNSLYFKADGFLHIELKHT